MTNAAMPPIMHNFVLDWRLALLLLAVFPVAFFFMVLVVGGYAKDYADAVQATNEMSGAMIESAVYRERWTASVLFHKKAVKPPPPAEVLQLLEIVPFSRIKRVTNLGRVTHIVHLMCYTHSIRVVIRRTAETYRAARPARRPRQTACPATPPC